MSEAGKLLEQYGAIHIKNVVSKDMACFFTSVLQRAAFVPDFKKGDQQIPNAKAIIDHDVMFDTLLEVTWSRLEDLLGYELLPTYSYARLYGNDDELKPHKDRPACEISVTVQLGRSHHYAWPIYMGGKRYDLAEGDGVVYKGCDIEHWRDKCVGPEDYYSGQVFLHFVRKNGEFASEYGDSKNRQLWDFMFIKNRNFMMENK